MKLPATLGQTLGRIVPVKMPAFALAPAAPIPHAADEAAILAELEARVRKPIVAGMAVVVVFVLGTFVWSAVASLHGAITTPGFLRVESSRKTIKHRDGGVVREILVKEGDTVKQGEVLIRMDDTTPRAQAEVLASGLDGLLVQRARLYAERDGADAITLPKEIQARASDPEIAMMVRDQENLFKTRKASLESQFDVLRKRMDQSQTRLAGLDATIRSIDSQSALIQDELTGVQSLYEKALVPKTRVRQLERTAAELVGNRGAQLSEVARTKELMSESEFQIASMRQTRSAEVAEALRDVQAKINDTLPRLHAARETLDMVEVRAPDDGYVLNLTQFTKNGVVTPGERLMDIVPTDAPLVVEAKLKPDEAYEVTQGMKAHIQLATYEARQLPPIPAIVTKVSADRQQDQRTGEPYFTVELNIEPEALKDLVKHIRLYPGMSATAMIGTGERTVLDYVTAPVRDSLRGALKER
jgi:HlyD family secretion protein/epimerase transport system membrane fusion protein